MLGVIPPALPASAPPLSIAPFTSAALNARAAEVLNTPKAAVRLIFARLIALFQRANRYLNAHNTQWWSALCPWSAPQLWQSPAQPTIGTGSMPCLV